MKLHSLTWKEKSAKGLSSEFSKFRTNLCPLRRGNKGAGRAGCEKNTGGFFGEHMRIGEKYESYWAF